jgi:predicted N-formylglutamate amidohydrolase
MQDYTIDSSFGPAVTVRSAQADCPVLIVCEHASNRIPDHMGRLGLSVAQLQSHIAWDPGALGVSRALADILGASLVNGEISRLVYDCNRPPEAHDAMPERSEIHDIAGNVDLNGAARNERVEQVYAPFRDTLAKVITDQRPALMVTVHSFTPVYRGTPRAVELGILHGSDVRFAQAMLHDTPKDLACDVRLNEPYAAADGVAHTLDLHGAKNGMLNVMLEIRNDLIATPDAQQSWADRLAPWLMGTLDRLKQEQAA